MTADIMKIRLTDITHFLLMELHYKVFKPKTLNLNLIKSLDITAHLKEIQSTEKYVK